MLAGRVSVWGRSNPCTNPLEASEALGGKVEPMGCQVVATRAIIAKLA